VARPELIAQPREITGKHVARIRREGLVPAVVYGHGVDSESIQVNGREFDHLRRVAGRNALVDLKVADGRARPVLVHGIQEHPVHRSVLHVDFFVVRMTEELTVDVPVVMTGESEAVEKQGGTLLHMLDTIKVRALPADLPQTLELDISRLVDFDSVLHVSDVPIPERVTLVTEAEEPLARVQAPRIEEEPVVAEAPEAEEAEGEAEAEGEGGAEGETDGSAETGSGRGEEN